MSRFFIVTDRLVEMSKSDPDMTVRQTVAFHLEHQPSEDWMYLFSALNATTLLTYGRITMPPSGVFAPLIRRRLPQNANVKTWIICVILHYRANWAVKIITIGNSIVSNGSDFAQDVMCKA